MGIFSGQNLNQHRSAGGGVYFRPGTYTCRLLSSKVIEYGNGNDKDTAFVAEFEVLEAQPVDDQSNKIGTRPSQFVKISDAKFQETSLGNIADFMRAAIACRSACEGEDEVPNPADVEIDDDLADAIVGNDQPLVGTVMRVIAANVKTKAGNDFTKIRYEVPENAQEWFSSAESAA